MIGIQPQIRWNNLLSQQQYGYRNNYFTSLAITDRLVRKPSPKSRYKIYILCGLLRSNRSIWLSESLHIADKTWALRCKRKHV